MTNTCFTVLIEHCRLKHAVELDHGEDLATRLVPVADLPGLVAEERIQHSLVVVALYHFELWQRGLREGSVKSIDNSGQGMPSRLKSTILLTDPVASGSTFLMQSGRGRGERGVGMFRHVVLQIRPESLVVPDFFAPAQIGMSPLSTFTLSSAPAASALSRRSSIRSANRASAMAHRFAPVSGRWAASPGTPHAQGRWPGSRNSALVVRRQQHHRAGTLLLDSAAWPPDRPAPASRCPSHQTSG